MSLGGDLARALALFHRLSQAENKLSAVQVRQEADLRELLERCGRIESRLTGIETRLEELSGRIAAEAKAAAAAGAQAAVGTQLTELAVKIAELKSRIDGGGPPLLSRS